jgi:hypothetical protein
MSEIPRQNIQNINIHLKMKDRNIKQIFSKCGYQWEREGKRKG